MGTSGCCLKVFVVVRGVGRPGEWAWGVGVEEGIGSSCKVVGPLLREGDLDALDVAREACLRCVRRCEAIELESKSLVNVVIVASLSGESE